MRFLARLAWLPVVWLAPAVAAPAAYEIDQHNATIRFQSSFAGLLHPTGDFGEFRGRVVLDLADPTTGTIALTVADASIEVGFPGAADLMRSAAFFDSAHYPQIVFSSSSIVAGSASDHYVVHGELTIRGVTRPQILEAVILRQPTTPPTADIDVRGTVHRLDFGMTANRALVGDDIALTIHTVVTLP